MGYDSKVIAVTSDDTLSNCKLFKLKFHLTFDDDISFDADVT